MNDAIENMINAVEHIANKDAANKERQAKQAARARAAYMKNYVRRADKEKAKVSVDNLAHKLWKTTTVGLE